MSTTRAANRLQALQDALAFALANGWEITPGRTNSVRRIVKHDTPERIPASWWPGKTYTSTEFITFLVFDEGAAISAFHDTSRSPWVGRADRKVSVKRALEILLNPELSDIHQNH